MEKKLCSKCKESKELSEFYKSSRSKNGYACWCKSCARKHRKEHINEQINHILENGNLICNSCHEEKKIEEFIHNRRYCKNCNKIAMLEKYYKNRKRKPIPKEGYKFCNKCGQEKPLEEFNKKTSFCKSCQSKYKKEHREKNREKINKQKLENYYENREEILEKQKQYAKTESGKAVNGRSSFKRKTKLAVKLNDLSFVQEIEIKESQNYCCAECGKSEPEIVLTRDHIIPVVPSLVDIYQIDGGYHSKSNIQMLCRSCNSSKGNRLDHKGGVKMLVDLLVCVVEQKGGQL